MILFIKTNKPVIALHRLKLKQMTFKDNSFTLPNGKTLYWGPARQHKEKRLNPFYTLLKYLAAFLATVVLMSATGFFYVLVLNKRPPYVDYEFMESFIVEKHSQNSVLDELAQDI